jgi:membrane-bound lytic murein transglycosylase B
VHIGGSTAFTAVRHRLGRVVRTPWFGAALITPLVLVLAVGAAPPQHKNSMSDNGITPLAAVANTGDSSSTTIVAATRPLPFFHIAAANVSAPPPAVVVNSPGSLRIPMIALTAYQNAERMMAAAYPGCGISWNLLAGIGRIESLHANGGATDPRGTAINPIYPGRQRGHRPERSGRPRQLCAGARADAVPAWHLGALRLRRRR